jgi:hypothetical protein
VHRVDVIYAGRRLDTENLHAWFLSDPATLPCAITYMYECENILVHAEMVPMQRNFYTHKISRLQFSNPNEFFTSMTSEWISISTLSSLFRSMKNRVNTYIGTFPPWQSQPHELALRASRADRALNRRTNPIQSKSSQPQPQPRPPILALSPTISPTTKNRNHVRTSRRRPQQSAPPAHQLHLQAVAAT